MSAKATGLVWDLECPKKYGELEFKPSHKYVLVAYADHADHNGKNIWPAVRTIAKKTGLDERSIQRLTRDLESMGMLIEDGTGPRGTNRWSLPYDEGGDKLSPLTNCQGDKKPKSLGDIPSGDIPSGDKLPPEVKEPEPLINLWNQILEVINPHLKGNNKTFLTAAQPVAFEKGILTLAAQDETSRAWLEDHLSQTINRAFPGLGMEAAVEFVVVEAQA